MLIPPMGGHEVVVINVHNRFSFEQFVHLASVAAAVGGGNGISPILFPSEYKPSLALRMPLLPADQQVGAVTYAIQLAQDLP